MKPFCQYCFNDPVTHLQQKEMCGTCEMETEVAKRESICLTCEHLQYCSMAIHRKDGGAVMLGCSRFIAKHKQTRGDWIRSMSDEELAKWLVRVEAQILRVQPMLERFALEKDWLEWLQKECE